MKSGGVDTLQMFKCVRDPMGIKCRICVAAKSCQENPRWFHKKVDLEAHLLKEHGVRTVLPRGLKIVEEEEALEGSPRYFSKYERERSINRFFNVDQKYNRARLSHLRTIKQKALDEYNAIPNDLRSCTEAEFVQNFTRHEIEKYDSTKEKRIEKIKAKIAKGYDFYVSILFLITLIELIIFCQFDTL